MSSRHTIVTANQETGDAVLGFAELVVERDGYLAMLFVRADVGEVSGPRCTRVLRRGQGNWGGRGCLRGECYGEEVF